MRRLLAVTSIALTYACAPKAPANALSEAQALVDNWVNAINSGDGSAALDKYLAADYVWHLPGDNIKGRDAVKKIFADMFQKCPHLRTKAEHVVTDGQYVVRWTESCSPDVPSTSDITIDRFGHGQFLKAGRWPPISLGCRETRCLARGWTCRPPVLKGILISSSASAGQPQSARQRHKRPWLR
jgi:predicted SnoaL-like aldol condensation-catalyzing enzyme